MIPKTIHQIWIQGYDELPDKERGYVDNNKGLGLLRHVLWDDKMIRQVMPEDVLEKYDDATIWAQKADIARYWILYRYGGLYVDADAKMLKVPGDIWDYDLVVGKTTPFNPLLYVNNGIIACKVGCAAIKEALDRYKLCNKNDFVCMFMTSPRAFSDIVKENDAGENILVKEWKVWEPCGVPLIGCLIDKSTEIVHRHSLSWLKRPLLVSILLILLILYFIKKKCQ